VVAAIKEHRKLDKTELKQMERLNEEMWANLPAHYQWLKDWEYV